MPVLAENRAKLTFSSQGLRRQGVTSFSGGAGSTQFYFSPYFY